MAEITRLKNEHLSSFNEIQRLKIANERLRGENTALTHDVTDFRKASQEKASSLLDVLQANERLMQELNERKEASIAWAKTCDQKEEEIERLREANRTTSIATTAEIVALKAEIERLRVQLSGCGVAAMQDTRESAKNRVKEGDYGWSASYGDVCRQIDKLIEAREQRKRDAEKLYTLHTLTGSMPKGRPEKDFKVSHDPLIPEKRVYRNRGDHSVKLVASQAADRSDYMDYATGDGTAWMELELFNLLFELDPPDRTATNGLWADYLQAVESWNVSLGEKTIVLDFERWLRVNNHLKD
ncbi:MAG: hypothetical protein ABSG53_07985 [Thermoguttaceae bacterium]